MIFVAKMAYLTKMLQPFYLPRRTDFIFYLKMGK